jgi:hypothetical protein
MHKELNYLCIRHLQFLFWPSLGATIGTKSWHEGIAAIMKMAVCEVREKMRETDRQPTDDGQTVVTTPRRPLRYRYGTVSSKLRKSGDDGLTHSLTKQL